MTKKITRRRVNTFGRRTGLDVRAGKRIRVNDDEIERFDDYFTSSDENTVESISPPLVSSPSNLNAPRMSSFIKNMNQSPRREIPEKINFIKTPTLRKQTKEKELYKSVVHKQITEQKKISAKGRRTGTDIFAGKEIQMINGIENFDNYFTDSSVLTSIHDGKVSINKPSNTKYASPDKISSINQESAVHKPCLNVIDSAELASVDATSKSKKLKIKSPTGISSTVNELESVKTQPRRSGRTRFPPMEHWRNQRLHIKYENGNIASVEVEEGNEPFTANEDRIRKTQKKYREKKKNMKKSKRVRLQENSMNLEQIKSNLSKTEVLNPHTGEEELVHLYRPHDTLLWTVPPPQDKNDASYTIAKCFSSKLMSFGFIEISAGKWKKKQLSPEHNIAFNVVKGNRIKLSIYKTSFSLKELDFIVVPAGNTYSIQNKGKTDAILNFSTFKTPMFDFQFPDTMKDHD